MGVFEKHYEKRTDGDHNGGDAPFVGWDTQTVSSSECTGMMPIPPENEDEVESYQELFSVEAPIKREPPR